MRRLSWTQYSMFKHCPTQYYLQYMTDMVAWVQKPYFQVGSAVHEAIAISIQQNKTPAEMVAIFQTALKKEGMVDPDSVQYNSLVAMRMFQGWFAWKTKHNINVLAVEEKITKDNFLGIVDCVAEIDGKRYIIDWKTSSRPYDQKRADTDGQVTVYTWLAKQYEPEAVAYGVLCKGTGDFQFLSSTRTDEDVQEFLADLQKMRETIQTYHTVADPPMNIGSHCDYCAAYECGVCMGRDDF